MTKKVSFWATKKIKKPVKVKFVNREGEMVSFTAHKDVLKPVKVTFNTNGLKMFRITCPKCGHSSFLKGRGAYYCPYCGSRVT